MDWQQHAITGALTAAALAAFARIGMRSPVVQTGSTTVLAYPKALRWFLVGGAAFFVAMIVTALWPLVVGTATDKDVRTAALAVAIGVPLLSGCVAEQRVRLVVDASGIGGRTAFRGQRRIDWRDVVEVHWSPRNQWFLLVDRHGAELRVHRFLQGHAVVPSMLREHVPEPVWRDAVAAWERALAG